MEITKQSLIDLVKACAKDPEMINLSYGVKNNNYNALLKGIEAREIVYNIFNNEYYYKGADLSYSSSDFKKLKFEKLPENKEQQISYSIRIVFDKMPNINIESTIEYTLYDAGKIPAKNGFWKSAEKVEFKTKKMVLKFIVKCGGYEFELTQDEAKNLYDTILTERKAYFKSIEDAEIKERFVKYLK